LNYPLWDKESTECNIHIMPPNSIHFLNINESINDVMTKNNGISNPTYRNKVLRPLTKKYILKVPKTSLHAHIYKYTHSVYTVIAIVTHKPIYSINY